MDYPPPNLILALNGYQGVKKIQMLGRNAAISNSAETVWGPGATYVRLSAGTACEVVSSSANDAAAGTGARTVMIKGVDANYAPFMETLTLNGTTAVALANTSILGVNKFCVATAGSGGTNAGTIDLRTVAGSVIKSEITTGATLGLGQAADFIYTIPASYYGVMGDIQWSGTGVTGDITVYLNSISSTGVLFNEGAGKSSLYVTAFNGAMGKIHFGVGQVFAPKTTLELRAIVSAGAGDLVAMADLYLVSTTKWGTGN